jgi:hypothetical protein
VSGGGKKISSKLKIYPPPYQKSNGPSLSSPKVSKMTVYKILHAFETVIKFDNNVLWSYLIN